MTQLAPHIDAQTNLPVAVFKMDLEFITIPARDIDIQKENSETGIWDAENFKKRFKKK